MKHIYVIRTAPYDYNVVGMDLYDGFNAVIKEEYDPELLSSAQEFMSTKISPEIYTGEVVYCHKDTRSVCTAKFISDNVKQYSLLTEIKYVMEDFILKEDFYDSNDKPDVNKARKLFFESFVHGKTTETPSELFERIQKLLSIIKREPCQNIVIIAHGFYLKLLEVYLKDVRIVNEPTRLLDYYSGERIGYGFCEGIHVVCHNDEFVFNNEIRNGTLT